MQVKITITNSEEVMQERMEEFRRDPDKMIEAERFVDGIVAKATVEAARRRREGVDVVSVSEVERAGSEQGSRRKQSRWHFRFRGFLLRAFATICMCNPSAGGSQSS